MSLKFGLDTSCIVALLSAGHAQHAATLKAYAERRQRLEQPLIPVPVLLESFAVLTQSPAPLFVPPEQARQLLVDNFAEVAEIAAVSGSLGWAAMDELAARSLGGGMLYDTVIAQSCLRAGAKVLLTWNVRDFLRVAPPALEIRHP